MFIKYEKRFQCIIHLLSKKESNLKISNFYI